MKIGEIWALPPLLRFVLHRNLRSPLRCAERARKMRLVANANEVADTVLASADGSEREQTH